MRAERERTSFTRTTRMIRLSAFLARPEAPPLEALPLVREGVDYGCGPDRRSRGC
jgi:hypothetical protein